MKTALAISLLALTCFANDVTGWIGLKWGDSVKRANQELKPLSLCQPIYLTDKKFGGCTAIQPQASPYNRINIGGESPSIRLVFEKTNGGLIEVQLKGIAIDKTSLVSIKDTLLKKYGEPDKSPSAFNSLWIKQNGILEITMDPLKKQYIIEYSSNASPKALQLHQQNYEDYL